MGLADAWLGGTFPLSAWTDDVDASYDAERLIKEKPTSIVIQRGGTALSAQTVRIEEYRGNRTVQSGGRDNRTVQAEAILLGYKNHATIADTDLQVGDRFSSYEVRELVPNTLDFLQAYLLKRD